MSNIQTISKALLTINTDDLPPPDGINGNTPSNRASNANISQPQGHTPDVVDSGRITFGATARRSGINGLPHPTGAMWSVTDTGRIGLGATARLLK